jgi:hypothetical protein
LVRRIDPILEVADRFWPVWEIVVWDQDDEVWVGEDGDSPHPLGVCPPDMPSDWSLDGDEDEDPSFIILDAIEEDFHLVAKVERLKIKGMREVLNLKSSINYDDASVPSQRRKGKARVL